MSQRLSSSHVVEQELQQLQVGIQSSLEVLQQLQGIKAQLGDLVTTHNQAKASLDSMTTKFNERQKDMKRAVAETDEQRRSQAKRFAELEAEHQARWNEYQETYLKHQRALQTTVKNVRTELGVEVSDLRGDVEARLERYQGRLDDAHQEIEGAQEALQRQLIEAKNALEGLRKKLESVVQEQAQVAPQVAALKGQVKIARSVGFIALLFGALGAGTGTFLIASRVL